MGDTGNLEPLRARSHTHTHNVRYTVLLIIMGVETPRWKKHQGLSYGLNCIGTVGCVSVHVNPCHVITGLSAANSVEATTCVAVQLRRNTTDPRYVYYGRSFICTTNYSLSAVGMLVNIYKSHSTSPSPEYTKQVTSTYRECLTFGSCNSRYKEVLFTVFSC
jgi:hypothetical protein